MNNRSNIVTALLGMVLGVLLTSLAVRIVSNQKKFDGDYNRWRKLNLILQEHKQITVNNGGKHLESHRNADFEAAVFLKTRKVERNYGHVAVACFAESLAQQMNIV